MTPSGKSSATIAAALNARRVLPDPAGTGQGQERNVLTQKQVAHRGQLPLPSNERGARQRHLVGLLDDSDAVMAALPVCRCAMKMIAPLQQRPA